VRDYLKVARVKDLCTLIAIHSTARAIFKLVFNQFREAKARRHRKHMLVVQTIKMYLKLKRHLIRNGGLNNCLLARMRNALIFNTVIQNSLVEAASLQCKKEGKTLELSS
jgi:hypothetical protein